MYVPGNKFFFFCAGLIYSLLNLKLSWQSAEHRDDEQKKNVFVLFVSMLRTHSVR